MQDETLEYCEKMVTFGQTQCLHSKPRGVCGKHKKGKRESTFQWGFVAGVVAVSLSESKHIICTQQTSGLPPIDMDSLQLTHTGLPHPGGASVWLSPLGQANLISSSS